MTEILGASLPNHWAVAPLKRVTTFLGRGTAPDYVDVGPIRALSQAANQDGKIDWSRTRFHNYGGDPRKLKGYLKSEDVVVNSTGNGTLGRVGFFRGAPDGIPCVADGHVTVARYSPDSLNPRFGYYWMRSELFQRYMQTALVVGATNQVELNGDRLASAPVPVPPLQEQRRIADFLDAETARTERVQYVTTKQATLLSEQLRETIRVATTTGFGEQWQVTGIPWMPNVSKGWKLFRISHAFGTGSGTTPTSDRTEYFDGPYPWVNSADLNDGYISASRRSVTRKALQDFSALKIHPPGSLVVALYGQGATKGRVGVLRIAACLNQACCALVPNGHVDSEYAAYWFRAHKEGIVALAYGAGQPNLSQELIRQLRIPAPEVSEQRSIVGRLRAVEEQVQRKLNLLYKREDLLAERRQALITAAVTGQIDVSTASGRGIED